VKRDITNETEIIAEEGWKGSSPVFCICMMSCWEGYGKKTEKYN
jgi:hypothetical protein